MTRNSDAKISSPSARLNSSSPCLKTCACSLILCGAAKAGFEIPYKTSIDKTYSSNSSNEVNSKNVVDLSNLLSTAGLDQFYCSRNELVDSDSHKDLEMDKAIFLQKQVRENSEDLQKELRDMVAWEEEMKRKDFEIRNAKDDQELPPVRSKKKKKAPVESNIDKEQSKQKRIAGTDYQAWEKFDPDQACKAEDNNGLVQKEEIEFEIPSKEQLEKEHQEATAFKDEGNALVQKKEYAKAVGKYSQAIKIFPHDAVFYANRALCQLKLDNLHSADADCTQAIHLDEKYVKAYHRRATARIELKRYKDAKRDLEKVLELEPSNKDAALKLKQIEEKLKKSENPTVIEGEKDQGSSIEKSIGEKLFGKKSTGGQKSQNETSKSDKESKNKSVKVNEPQTSTTKEKLLIEEVVEETDSSAHKKLSSKNKKRDINDTSEKKSSNSQISEEGHTTEDEIPPWLPKLKEGVHIVQPPKEVPRQLKKTLKRIEVTEIPENESIFHDIIEEKLIKEKIVEENDISKNVKKKPKSVIENCNKLDNQVNESLPLPPKTSVAFFLNWCRNTSDDFRYKYLKQIVPKHFPAIIKASMESSVFSDIIFILNTKFVTNGDKVYDWLYCLSKLERFRALILFMTQADKEALKNLLEYCKTKEGKTDDELNNLCSAYEL